MVIASSHWRSGRCARWAIHSDDGGFRHGNGAGWLGVGDVMEAPAQSRALESGAAGVK